MADKLYETDLGQYYVGDSKIYLNPIWGKN